MLDRIPVVYEDMVDADVNRKSKYELIWDYVINDGNEHPIAIIVPGGGYGCVCSFVEGKPFAKYLNRKGISAVILYYRVGEEAKYPNPQDDLAKAVKEVSARADELKLDMKNYSIWGSSAGGHLVGSFGTNNMGYPKYGIAKPATLVLIYPVITMDPSYTHDGTMENLIGNNPSTEDIKFYSVDTNVTKDYPPTYIWCGDTDDVVPPKNTEDMIKALNNVGVSVAYKIAKGVGHGAGLAYDTDAEGWIDEAIDFWMEQKIK